MEHRMDSQFVQLQIPTQMKNGLPTLFSMCLNSNSHRRHHFFSTTGSTLRSLVRLLNWILRSAGSLGAIATKERNGINTHERIYTHAHIHTHTYTLSMGPQAAIRVRAMFILPMVILFSQ